jgi:uncharacterized protein YbcI
MPKMAEGSVTQQPSPGHILGRISNELVSLHKATCGKGATDAVTHAVGDTVVCVMRGILTLADQTLVRAGEVSAVRVQRERLHHAMRSDAKAVVERHTGRAVATVLFAVEPVDEVETIVFILELGTEAGSNGDGLR